MVSHPLLTRICLREVANQGNAPRGPAINAVYTKHDVMAKTPVRRVTGMIEVRIITYKCTPSMT